MIKHDFDLDGNLVVGGVTLTSDEAWDMISRWLDVEPSVAGVLHTIASQLRSCSYTCEAGLLELNVAFQALESLAAGRTPKLPLDNPKLVAACKAFIADIDKCYPEGTSALKGAGSYIESIRAALEHN